MTTGKDLNNPTGVTEYNFSLDGSEDDWTGVDVTKEATDRQKAYSEELKTCFGYRQVKTVLPRKMQKKLSVFRGKAPSSQESYVLSLARKPSKLLSLFQREISVYPHKPKDYFPTILPAIEPSDNPQEYPVHISASDEALINNLSPSEPAYVRQGSRGIFCNNDPKPEDVRQTDRRSTCYLMSTLASYASSSGGKKILKNMITPVDKDHVIVTFYDKIIGDNVQVLVSTARLVDKNGKDFYSFNNPTEACWPGIIEKAYHAYKLTRSTQLREQIQKADDQSLIDKEFFLHNHLQSIAPLDETKSLLDWGDMSHAIGCMSGLPLMTEIPQDGAHYHHQKEASFIQEEEFKTLKAQQQLKFNIDMGIPVILGTPPLGTKGFFRTITTGSPTGHAIGVLGSADLLINGRLHQGILVYDPYGVTLDGGEILDDTSAIVQMSGKSPSIEAMNRITPLLDRTSPEDPDEFELIDDSHSDIIGSLVTKAAGRSVRFYRFNELHNYFAKGAIAPGGYQ